jgi:hypothetical protein
MVVILKVECDCCLRNVYSTMASVCHEKKENWAPKVEFTESFCALVAHGRNGLPSAGLFGRGAGMAVDQVSKRPGPRVLREKDQRTQRGLWPQPKGIKKRRGRRDAEEQTRHEIYATCNEIQG